MTTYLTTNLELLDIADAIREKGGTTAALTYPDGFVTAINNITISPVSVTVSGGSVTKITGTDDDYRLTMS